MKVIDESIQLEVDGVPFSEMTKVEEVVTVSAFFAIADSEESQEALGHLFYLIVSFYLNHLS